MKSSPVVRNALQLARRRQRAAAGLSLPLPGGKGIGRRALLKAMGAGAALAALPLAACRATGSQQRVAVVGGGLAGLNALHTLAGAGVEARLYEAANRIGGRVFTRSEFPGTTGWVEMGGQLVNTDHADMFALCEEFGLELIDGLALGGTDQIVRDRLAIPDPELVAALGPIAAQIAADSEALDADWETNAPAIDAMSTAQYLDLHADKIGSVAVRRLLEQTMRSEYGVEPAEASALQLIFNLPTVDGEAYEVLSTSDERFVVRGGSQRVTDALAAAHESQIERGRKLAALAQGDNGVTLSFEDGTTAEADHVILTLPASLLGSIDHGGLFDADWQAYASEVTLGRNDKLNAAYTGRPWQATMGAWAASWDAGDDPRFVEVWECTAGSQDSQGAVLTWFFGGDQITGMGDPGLRAAVEARVGDTMGDLAGTSTEHSARTGWSTGPLSRGAYVNYGPGQLTRFGGQLWVEEDDGSASQVARSGPILFAGEHLSDAWPGFMNGAAQTGRMAAEAVLAQVNAS